jgi:sugar phosphate isomerase/epimerase
MSRLSVSTIAFPKESSFKGIITSLSKYDILNIELALTSVWPNLDHLHEIQVRELSKYLYENGIGISGLQSLLFGHPELQLFDRSTWAPLIKHLKRVFDFGGILGASVAVLGAPRNRIKGSRSFEECLHMFADFFSHIEPTLKSNSITLTLEPNAKAYGTDWCTSYSEAVEVCSFIGSRFLRPQLDLGCAIMESDPFISDWNGPSPAHVHISSPDLAPPPGTYNHSKLISYLDKSEYDGKIVLEMLAQDGSTSNDFYKSLTWFSTTYMEMNRN